MVKYQYINMSGKGWLVLMGGMFLLTGAGFMAKNVLTPWRVTGGQVLRSELIYDKDAADPTDVASKVQIEYRYLYEGQYYTGRYASILSSGEFFKRRFLARHLVGGSIQIRVDPKNPGRSQIKTDFFRENETALMLIGAGMVFFFLLLFLRGDSKPPEYPKLPSVAG